MHSNTEEAIDEALAILEEETDRRINDLNQRVNFICAALRAEGKTQINRMLKSVRQLTIEEFCGTYKANVEKFLNAQAKQRSVHSAENARKSRVIIDEHDLEGDNLPKRQRSSSSVNEPEKSISHDRPDIDKETKIEEESQQDQQQQQTLDRFSLKIKREALSSISIELDPEYTNSDAEQLTVEEPEGIMSQLNDQQKQRLVRQILKLQETLNAYKEKLV